MAYYASSRRPRPRKMNKSDRLRKETKGACGYCGVHLPKDRMTRDHIVPMSKGGPNAMSNLLCCCESCNQLKGDKSLEEFRAFCNGGDLFWFEVVRDAA